MTIINEPRYKDFNGNVHRTEKQCITAENDFVAKVLRTLNELATGCKNQKDCWTCPFHNNDFDICIIDDKTGNLPVNWNIEEEE